MGTPEPVELRIARIKRWAAIATASISAIAAIATGFITNYYSGRGSDTQIETLRKQWADETQKYEAVSSKFVALKSAAGPLVDLKNGVARQLEDLESKNVCGNAHPPSSEVLFKTSLTAAVTTLNKEIGKLQDAISQADAPGS